MSWLTWRQFRTQALIAVAVVAVAGVSLLVTGAQMHHTYAADVAGCTAHQDCSDVLSQFVQSYHAALNLMELLLVLVPCLIGMFWGAPLVGRELETGTHLLAWAQSVTRTRWLAFKLPSTTETFSINRNLASKAQGLYLSGGGSEFFFDLPVPAGAWVISSPPVEDASGKVLAAHVHLSCLFPSSSGSQPKTGAPPVVQVAGCLARYDLHESITYQPASHYWPLQWYETGIYLVLGAILSGFCFWQTRLRRI